jgi:hypothetical protein
MFRNFRNKAILNDIHGIKFIKRMYFLLWELDYIFTHNAKDLITVTEFILIFVGYSPQKLYGNIHQFRY